MPRCLWESRLINPLILLIVGVGASTLATFVQIVLWWLADMPVLETLFRDAHLTAALLMGPGVLPPPSTARWDILMVASLIHFALSITYAFAPTPAVPTIPCTGKVIYVVNLYGFTQLFLWFSVARDWVTQLTHLVFGIGLTAGSSLPNVTGKQR